MTDNGPKFADREGSAAPDRPKPRHTVYEMPVDAVRALDRAAIDEFGIPGIVLMENAALGILPKALEMIADPESGVLILCGSGNNAGDGLALARHLANQGVRVRVALATPPGHGRGDAATNLAIVTRMSQDNPGLTIEPLPSGASTPPSLIIDAIFGTGLSRPVEGPAAGAIGWMNGCKPHATRVLAIDVPSGLDADSGLPVGGPCVRADATVTLAALKPGLCRLEAQAYVGDLTVAGIGVPESLLRRFGTPRTPHPGLGWGPQ